MRAALIIACCALLGGCYIAGMNGPVRRSYARILVPRLDDGRAAVEVLGARSRNLALHQATPLRFLGNLTAFSLRRGTHVLELQCNRPNATIVVSDSEFLGFLLEVSVEPDTTYVLDCAPEHYSPNGDIKDYFLLTRIEAEIVK